MKKPTRRANRVAFHRLLLVRPVSMILLGLLSAGSAMAQEKTVAVATTGYQQTLGNLSTTYAQEVDRLQQKVNQSKELYNEGLIARVELEADEKALADAQAKVTENNNQIALARKSAEMNFWAASIAAADSNQSWTTGDDKIDTLIRYYANQYGVDAYLIYCLMSQESGFSRNASSPKGAQGLMQLMPATAARYGVNNPFDVSQSIMGGAHYLKDLLQMFGGRVDLALAAYNAGENAVIKYGYTVPPYQETRDYVRLISARYAKK